MTTPPATSPKAGAARVMVVDDSPFMRKAISRMIEADPALTVVGTASDGVECLRKIRELRPDVLALDIMMPNMDGLAVLGELMREDPLPVIVVSSATAADAEVSIRALELGAVDVVDKPKALTNMDVFQIGPELLDKLKVAAGIGQDTLRRMAEDGARRAEPAPRRSGAPADRRAEAGAPEAAVPAQETRELDGIVIGASTGGPPALQRIVAAISSSATVPVAIVQHMPLGFTTALASRLDNVASIPVKEAEDGDVFAGGRILVAHAGLHMHFEKRRGAVVVRLDRTPGGTAHMPSIDVTMSSAAEVLGARAMGVLLTGMGADGARGLLAMRQAGAHTIAEAESSAVIYGMPKAAADLRAASEILDIEEVLGRIAAFSRH